MKQPLFTIVTSTFNAADAIEVAVESVRSQHRDDIEYIIVDGASKDNTLSVVERNRDVVTTVISEPDTGIYDALNKGVRAAQGKLIGIIGADDSLVPGALDAVARQFRQSPADIYAGQTLLTNDSGRGVLRADETYGPGALVSGIPFGHNAMFATREAYEKVGLYDTSYRIVADANWVHRAIRAGLSCARIDRVLVQFASTGVSSNDGSRVLDESGRAIRENFPMLSQQEALDLLYGVRGWSGPHVLEDVLAQHRDRALHEAVRAALDVRADVRDELFLRLQASAGKTAKPKAAARSGKAKVAPAPVAEPPLVSFIIPAYNVEDHVGRCLESITKEQGVENVEVIIVDDGSTDGTAAVIQSYMARDKRIKLIQQRNAGQGAARAEALKHATGKYIWCVDSDDRIQSRILERLLNIFAEHDGIDAVVLNFAYEEENGDLEFSGLVPSWLGNTVANPTASEEVFAAISSWTCPPWRFLVKRELLTRNRISFHPGFFYEDHPFAVDVMTAAKQVYVDTPVSYFYLRRAGSTVRTLDRRCFDFIKIRRLVLDRLAKRKLIERFPAMAASYVFPIDFVRALVPAELRAEFLETIWNDIRPQELAIVRRFGTRDEIAMAKAGEDGVIAHVDVAPMRSGYSQIGAHVPISRTLKLRNVEGLESVDGPYPEIGLPQQFCWVSGRELNVRIRREQMVEPLLVLRVRCHLPEQFLLVEQNDKAIEAFPCRGTQLEQAQDIAIRLIEGDQIAVTIECAQSDGSERDLSIMVERIELIEASDYADPDFDLDKWANPPRIVTGDRTRLEAINVDVRCDPQPRPYLRIGDESHVGGTFVFERGLGEITIGNRSSIGGGCLLICTQDEGIHIGDNVMLSWNVTVIDSNSHSANPDIRANDAFDWLAGVEQGRMGHFKDWSSVKSAPIYIKDGAWIGFGSSIMKGVTIGKGAIVGSNSVVTKDVPDGAIVGGNPARVLGQVPGMAKTVETAN